MKLCTCALLFWLAFGYPFFASGDEAAYLKSIYGTQHSYDEFVDERTQAIVFIVLDENCPVVRQLLPELIRLHEKYNDFEKDRAGLPQAWDKYPGEKVQIMGVYTRSDYSIQDMAQHALMNSIPFRVLHDHDHDFVDKFGVTRLSESLVFDRNWNLVYQGPVNDQFFQGGSKPQAAKNYLEDAIDGVLANPPQTFPSKRPPVGCLISKGAQLASYEGVTFYKDVLPIVQTRCQKCHREGEVGPMPFETLEDFQDYADMIDEVLIDKRMPPWPGRSSHGFVDPELLAEEELKILLSWIRGNQEAGDPSDAPAPASFPDPGKWQIGKPDFVFKMPTPYTVPPTGTIDYVYYPVEINGGNGFPEDKWIESIETRPGSREVVHHIQVHEFTGKILNNKITPIELLTHYGLSIENAKLLGGYTPGNKENARQYGNNYDGKSAENLGPIGMRLRAGSNMIFELHYTPYGTETDDQSEVAIKFADKKPERILETWFPFRKRADLIIPANIPHHSLQDIYHFGNKTDGKPVLIKGIRPHMHSRGKSYRLEKIKANEISNQDMHDFSKHGHIRGEVVLTIPAWDFNWQQTFKLQTPLILMPDEALLATAFWDNSKHNPRNPDPDMNVPWGQQTIHEMFNTLFLYEALEEDDPRLLKYLQTKSL